jgi:hypothetical protein
MSTIAFRRPGMVREAMPGLALRGVAGAALAAEAAIHAALAPDHLHEIPYVGAGFVLASAGSLLLLLGLVAPGARAWPWRLGVALCAGLAVAFTASRTVGLPGLHEDWTSDHGLGLAALAGEVLFVACALLALPASRRRLPL